MDTDTHLDLKKPTEVASDLDASWTLLFVELLRMSMCRDTPGEKHSVS